MAYPGSAWGNPKCGKVCSNCSHQDAKRGRSLPYIMRGATKIRPARECQPGAKCGNKKIKRSRALPIRQLTIDLKWIRDASSFDKSNIQQEETVRTRTTLRDFGQRYPRTGRLVSLSRLSPGRATLLHASANKEDDRSRPSHGPLLHITLA
jgi:hypothetical protein